jgi:CBS domain-containing protein
MSWIPERLQQVAKAVVDGDPPTDYTTRDLLSWFGSQRRGRHVVASIRRSLRSDKLVTEQNFEYAYIDEPLTFTPLPPKRAPDEGTQEHGGGATPEVTHLTSAIDDPTYRLGKLDSANKIPVSINPNGTISQAITVMLYHDYSQLPVMQGERDIKGAVSWRSIGRKLALGHQCTTVQHCLEEASVISSDTSLFSAIPTIVEREYVLVKDHTNKIVGIVTTTDLSLQFRQLAEPFLLLGEIENHLRRLSDGRFTTDQVASVKDPSDVNRKINDLSDLTFGEHVRLLEEPERWGALELNVDRATFVKHLDNVRDVRNNVMHFDPDGVAPDDLAALRNFVRLLVALDANRDSEDAA